jgi:hypothetical protein
MLYLSKRRKKKVEKGEKERKQILLVKEKSLWIRRKIKKVETEQIKIRKRSKARV